MSKYSAKLIMSKYIAKLIMAEFNRIDHLPAVQFDAQYPPFHAVVMRMYGGKK